MVCKNITNYLLIHMFIQISASMCPYNYRGMLQEVCPQTLTEFEDCTRSNCITEKALFFENHNYMGICILYD